MVNSRRIFAFYCWTLFALFACMHLVHGMLRGADPDEFQTLVNAFDAARGLKPYVDYWDNHGPLAIWLLQPIVAAWHGGHSIIFWLRGVAWINTMLIAAGVCWFMRRQFTELALAPWIAGMFLLASPSFLVKTVEIRGDNPANLLATGALFALVFGLQRKRAKWFFVAGLCLGLIAGFTLKAVIIAAGLGFFWLTWLYREKSWPRVAHTAALAGGVALPVLAIGLALAVRGSLHGFLACYFGGNVTRGFHGFTSSGFTGIYKDAPAWTFGVTGVILFSIWKILKGRAGTIETGMCVLSLFYVAQFLLLLPTKNMQSLLPLYVPLCIVVGSILGEVVAGYQVHQGGYPTGITIVITCVALLFIRDMQDYNDLTNHKLPKQVRFADAVLVRSKDQQFVFDPTGIVFLKPKPWKFHVLVSFIRHMHQNGTIDLHIPKMLNSDNVDSVIFDDRTKNLRVTDLRFLLSNYVAARNGPGSVLLVRKTSDMPLPPHDSIGWRERGFEKAKAPSEPENPPKWYVRFMNQ